MCIRDSGHTEDHKPEHECDQVTADPGAALASRTHQLVDVELRPAPPQHRPLPRTATGPDRPRDHPHPHRQTRHLGQTMERLTRLSARALKVLLYISPK